jgi:hypothetical protein
LRRPPVDRLPFTAVMCYFLYVASPLTLSEIRAMLPAGITADLLPPADQQKLRELHPAARTGVRLLIGRCSCDLLISRDGEAREGERHLRNRFFAAGLDRRQVIAGLEAHRSGARPRSAAPSEWQAALAEFVAEHARNAGPTAYLLRFGADSLQAHEPAERATITTLDVRNHPAAWLVEDRLTTVVR